MKRLLSVVLFAALCAGALLAQQSEPQPFAAPGKPRFAPLYIYVDSGSEALAAYQFELSAKAGDVKIVGVEGGEHPAFAQPPYYDPLALSKNKIIIAAFNTGENLPKGRHRVATVHVQISGGVAPEYVVTLKAAATPNGERIPASVTVEKGE